MHRSFSLITLALVLSLQSTFAGDGDTTVVQTFTFSTPGSPKEGKFLFPPKTKRFEKILMHYKLKCDSRQSPACGEWDYITYTNVYEHTGRLDSTRMMQPNFTVNRAVVDTFRYVNAQTWSLSPRWERKLAIKDTVSFSFATLGTGSLSVPLPSPSARVLYLWRASELRAAGLTAGPISGIRLRLSQGSSTLRNARVRITPAASVTLSASDVSISTTQPVYESRITQLTAGWNSVLFSTPFAWDGTSNLLVDISYDETSSSTCTVAADDVGWNAGLVADEPDNYLSFNGFEYVKVDVQKLAALDTAVTVSFWQYGNPLVQPRDGSIIEALNAAGNRSMNVHLPWGNGRIYWDAGNTGGTYDRIERAADSPLDYEGRWNHWAFTKSSITGEMKSYLNGKLWHSGSGKTNPLTRITRCTIGANGAATGTFYFGGVDDVTVWNAVVDESTIRDWMHLKRDGSHPYHGSLISSLPFKQGSGSLVNDEMNTAPSSIVGKPAWRTFGGNRIKNFTLTSFRPQIVFEQGKFTATLDSSFFLDSLANAPVMVIRYGDTTRANIPTDTLYKYVPVRHYTYSGQGIVIDSAMMQPDGVMVRKDFAYYGAPFEVLNKYEIGRFITPYGINLDLGEGWTWISDVSDFRTLLADSVHLSAGNWQELLDLKFVFIEGTPPRDVVKVQNMWSGDFALSNFVARVPPKTVQLDPMAKAWKLRVTTSGHQFSNPTNCAEFCPKMHSLDINGQTRYTWQILQECAMNPLYPQGGTWIYDRAGWCPGMPVTTQEMELTPYVSGAKAEIDYNSEHDDYGNYVVESQLISYGTPNFSLNAAIEDVIAPSSHELNRRFNPSCNRPQIIIQNLGATPLTRCTITYGPIGGNTNTFVWNGSLAFNERDVVVLPSFDWGKWSAGNLFRFVISKPNGGNDEYTLNDTRTVAFDPVPIYTSKLIVILRTNNAANETSYEVVNAEGLYVTGRAGLANNTNYRDTLNLPPGCYEFILRDAGDDGLSFFLNSDGNGTISFRLTGGGLIKSLNSDFGKETRMQFRIAAPTHVEPTENILRSLELYPNPATRALTFAYELQRDSRLRILVFDASGREVRAIEQEGRKGKHETPISFDQIPSGSYNVMILADDAVVKVMNVNILR